MDIVIQVLVLMWIVLFVVTLNWSRVNNRGASIATWLILTIVTWWIEAAIAFFTLHAVLFSMGRDVAIAVAILTVAIMTLTPAAWAYGLSQWNKHRPVQP